MALPFGEHLPRLPRHHYQGDAVIHWQCTLDGRATGWLTEPFHARFREFLLHTAIRESLTCPVYCLMPDHFHLVWMGLRRESDQLNGMKFLRQCINHELECAWNRSNQSAPMNDRSQPKTTQCIGPKSASACSKPWRLQKQAYDQIIRPEERRRGAFQASCDYIRLNPIRAGLVSRDEDWPFGGCAVPGYPDLHPARSESWAIFWKVYVGGRKAELPMPPGTKPRLFDGHGAPWVL